MSPERLNRHHDPDDDCVVTWGQLREVGLHILRAIRFAYMLIAVSLILTIGTGSAVGLLIAKSNHQTRNAEKAVCGIVAYAEKQAANIMARDDIPRADAVKAATGLTTLASDMRSTGIRCPPKAN